MGKILYIGTYGTDDPTRATLLFSLASGALDSGHEPIFFLMGEAVNLLKTSVVDSIQGIGNLPMREFVNKMLDNQVKFYI